MRPPVFCMCLNTQERDKEWLQIPGHLLYMDVIKIQDNDEQNTRLIKWWSVTNQTV